MEKHLEANKQKQNGSRATCSARVRLQPQQLADVHMLQLVVLGSAKNTLPQLGNQCPTKTTDPNQAGPSPPDMQSAGLWRLSCSLICSCVSVCTETATAATCWQYLDRFTPGGPMMQIQSLGCSFKHSCARMMRPRKRGTQSRRHGEHVSSTE